MIPFKKIIELSIVFYKGVQVAIISYVSLSKLKKKFARTNELSTVTAQTVPRECTH